MSIIFTRIPVPYLVSFSVKLCYFENCCMLEKVYDNCHFGLAYCIKQNGFQWDPFSCKIQISFLRLSIALTCVVSDLWQLIQSAKNAILRSRVNILRFLLLFIIFVLLRNNKIFFALFFLFLLCLDIFMYLKSKGKYGFVIIWGKGGKGVKGWAPVILSLHCERHEIYSVRK